MRVDDEPATSRSRGARTVHLHGRPELAAVLGAAGWSLVGPEAAGLLWLDHNPSAGRLGAAPVGQRAHALPGIDALLDPDARRALVAGIHRRRGRGAGPDPRALPASWRLPAERDALLANTPADGAVLVLRTEDAHRSARWTVLPRAEAIEGEVGLARPVVLEPGARLVTTYVAVTGVLPLRASMAGPCSVAPFPGAAGAPAVPGRVTEATRARIEHTTRALLAAARASILDTRPGDFGLLAFEWHVAAAGEPTLVDVAWDPDLDDHPAARAALLGATDLLPSPDAQGTILFPDHAGPETLALFPAPRGEDIEAAGGTLPDALEGGVWRPVVAPVGSLDGLPVLHDPWARRLLPLDLPGAFVWAGLGEGASATALARELAEVHALPLAEAARDVWTVIARLVADGLVAHASDAPRPLPSEDVPPAPDAAPTSRRPLRIGAGRVDLVGADARLEAHLQPFLEAWEAPADDVPSRAVVVDHEPAGAQLRLAGARTDWVPEASWLVLDVHEALARRAAQAMADGLVLRAIAARVGEDPWLLAGAHGDTVHRFTARLWARGDLVPLGSPYVPITSGGAVAGAFPGGLVVPESARPGTLARLAAWRAARPFPRRLGSPARLLPMDPPPAREAPLRPARIVLVEQGDAPAEPLAPAAALAALVRWALPEDTPLGPRQARALVALVDRCVSLRVGAEAPPSVVAADAAAPGARGTA